MNPVPFIARWRLQPKVGSAFDGQLLLDDPAVFAGHYPGAPILPGTFLVEALVQAARTALSSDVGLEQIASCRFRSPLFPGDQLSAQFLVKDAGAGRALVDVTAQGRAPAAELSLLVAPVHAATPDGPAPAVEATSGHVLDPAFIARVLPHRPPALLVEHALVLDPSATRPELRAFKTITAAEPCFADAGSPPAGSYPRSLVVESFCQSCGLLRAAAAAPSDHRDQTRVPVVAKLANLRFLGDAAVGDRVEHQVRLEARTPDGAVFSGQAVVSGRVIMRVERVVAATAPIAPAGR
jgi:3-hydroxyacyl-[acyl-carrier-protein] dehydratase